VLCRRSLTLLAAIPHPAEEEVRRQAEKVFNRPEFTAREDLLQKVLRAIFEWLGGLHATAPVLFWILLVGCVVLLLLILAYIALTVRRAFHSSPRQRGEMRVARGIQP